MHLHMYKNIAFGRKSTCTKMRNTVLNKDSKKKDVWTLLNWKQVITLQLISPYVLHLSILNNTETILEFLCSSEYRQLIQGRDVYHWFETVTLINILPAPIFQFLIVL